jgi:hypothetical protein
LQPAIEFRHEIPVAGGDDRCLWLGSCACFFWSNDRRDEAIPLPGHGLYESWGVGVVLQDLPKLADCSPDTVVGIQENTLTPNPANDLISGNNVVPVLKQKEKDLERDALQLQHMSATAQPPRTQVKLVAFAEADRLLHSSWLGRHGTPHGSAMILHHMGKTDASANPACV